MEDFGKKRFFFVFLLLLTLGTPSLAEIREETDFPDAAFTRRHISPWGQDLFLKPRDGGPPLQFSALPVEGKISSLFGPRRAPKRGATRLHKGIDISAPRGTPVKAVAPGVVVFQGRNKAYGKMIDIDHGEGTITRYAHLDSYAVSKGARVKAGQTVGAVGRTGRATGCNLHFEAVIDDVPWDPLTPSLWAASLPKLEMLPRLFAVKGRSRPSSEAPARVPSARQRGSLGFADDALHPDGRRRSSAPLTGIRAAAQSRVSPPPRGHTLP